MRTSGTRTRWRTSSWDGAYAARPAGTPTFSGRAYTEAPVYHDPPSNQRMGMQGWGMERIAQLFHETGDERAEEILDRWVPWVVENITVSEAPGRPRPSSRGRVPPTRGTPRTRATTPACR